MIRTGFPKEIMLEQKREQDPVSSQSDLDATR
jgi:hypothetical protein